MKAKRKTIRIDDEAYNKIIKEKRKDKTISDVLIRMCKRTENLYENNENPLKEAFGIIKSRKSTKKILNEGN